MSGIRADNAETERVFIEDIQAGDWVVSTLNGGNGDSSIWQVHAKGWKWSQAGGQITLRSKGATDNEPHAVSAPPRTPILRVTSFGPASSQADKDAPSKVEGFQHPKCYANLYGGCCKEISGEHYFTHSMIKLYTFDDPEAKIMHNHGFGIPKGVSPKKFVVNALCVTHNTTLSVADDAALQFAKFVRRIALDFLGGAGEWGGPEEITIPGDDFERWTLKLLLNHAAGKAFSANQGKIHSPIPPVAIDYLLGKKTWPKGLGLCVAGDPKNQSLKFDPFTKLEHTLTDFWGAYPILWSAEKAPNGNFADQTLAGGIVELNGYSFGLSILPIYRGYTEVDGVGNWFRGCVERPDYVEWNLDGVGKRINFTWTNPSDHLHTVYNVLRGERP